MRNFPEEIYTLVCFKMPQKSTIEVKSIPYKNILYDFGHSPHPSTISLPS